MKVYEVPLTLVEHGSDIKIKAWTKNPSVICKQGVCLKWAHISGARLQSYTLLFPYMRVFDCSSYWSLLIRTFTFRYNGTFLKRFDKKAFIYTVK